METLALCIDGLCGVAIDDLHRKTKTDEIVTHNTPLDVEVGGPSSNPRVASIRENAVGRVPWNQ
jgi:hypothetical protein